ncbi:MAG: family 20 glycosylhydrolase [Planctomycetes bacterium]|nr:family 20 glycosylhydrolase [Planctomycetota bacterium]
MRAGLGLLLLAGASRLAAQQLAVDEFDGRRRFGWQQEGLGEWARSGGREVDGAFVTVGGNDWRALATPIERGTVWYAVTLRMRAPIEGYASVVPAASASTQFSEFGFNRGFDTDEALWTTAAGVVRSGLACTATQTLLACYELDRGRFSTWAAADPATLLDAEGRVVAPPRVVDAPLTARALTHVYLSKGSAQELEIHRIALARSARDALSPGGERSAPAASSPLAASDVPLRDEDRIVFLGDSITWQGGFVDRLAGEVASRRSGAKAVLQKCGINGGTATDLRDGVAEKFGTSQVPLQELLTKARATVAVIVVGVNDVTHGPRGNDETAYRRALVDLVRGCRAHGCTVVLGTPLLFGERARGTNPHDAALDRYAAIALEVAREEAAVGVDLRAACLAALDRVSGPRSEQGVLTYDGVHLSDAGNALVARELGAALAEALRRARALAPIEALVPAPRSVVPGEGEIRLGAASRIVAPDALWRSACVLAQELAAIGAPRLPVAIGEARAGDIELRLDPTIAGDAPERSRLWIGDRVVVSAAAPLALVRSTATLVQLARVRDGALVLPRVTIEDAPAFGYRGLLVDVARRPHSIATLERLVVLCRLYRLNHLQLHLTDDQAFTFPSRAFPRLATPGHSFTRAELVHLEDFARDRGVALVPELDVPGHGGALIAAMPELFRAHARHHATIAFAREDVLAALDVLIGELCEVFATSEFIHIGGDEADLEHVHESEDFQAAFRREGVADAQELYRLFLGRMDAAVRARGRRTLAWEGFAKDGRVEVPRTITVMAFEALYHLPGDLVRGGYPVINTSWRPLYVVNERAWSPAEILAWDPFTWRHFVAGFPAYEGLRIDPSPLVLGAQVCAWEQEDARELPSLRLRVAAFAERIWRGETARGVERMMPALEVNDALLDALLR